MKINYAIQSRFGDIQHLNFDIVICASGYEERCTFFYKKLLEKSDLLKEAKKICFTFNDRQVLHKVDNDAFFLKNGFDLFQYNSQLHSVIEIYDKIFTAVNKKFIRVVIDYSSMTKVIYAALVKYLAIFEKPETKIDVLFNYSPAVFSEPPELKGSMYSEPLPLFPTVELTDKKIALLASLGYEDGKAQGIIEYLQVDTNDIYLFYTSKTARDGYYNTVRNHNEYLIEKVPIDHQFEYELENIPQMFSILESLASYLINNSFRVLILPLGPKVFSLIAILVSMKYNDLTVFRVSDGIKGEPINKIANTERELIVVSVSFISE